MKVIGLKSILTWPIKGITMNLKVNTNYNHPTLGLVRLLNLFKDDKWVKVEVLTAEFTGNWTDDEGEFFYNYKGAEWWVNKTNLYLQEQPGPPVPKEVLIAKRIRRLWNNSNWVKADPQRSY